jgi:hypothetical protein
MAKLVICRKKDLNFRKFKISVNRCEFNLGWGEQKTIDLPDDNPACELAIQQDWATSYFKIAMDKERKILLRQYFPGWFYAVGSGICFLACLLYFFSQIHPLVFAVPILVYGSAITYSAIFKRKNYFKIKYLQ